MQSYYLTFDKIICKIIAPEVGMKYMQKYFRGTTVAITKDNIQRQVQAYLHLQLHQNRIGRDVASFSQKKNHYYLVLEGSVHVFFPALSTFLQRIFTHMIYDHEGLVIHASAVLYKKQVYIFTGPSGTGKTTLARRFATELNAQVIADNLVFVRFIGNQAILIPFPFDQYHNHDHVEQLPISAVFLLRQSEHHSIQPLTVAQKLGLRQSLLQVQAPEASRAVASKALFRFLLYTNMSMFNVSLMEDLSEVINSYVS